MTLNKTVSTESPTAELPISRSHKPLPLVCTLARAITYAFKISPKNSATSDAATIRHTTPSVKSYAAWFVQSALAGNTCTNQKVADVSSIIATLMTISRRIRRNPYTSVMISPAIYASGNSTVPASNTNGPTAIIFVLAILLTISVVRKSAASTS